MGEYAEAYTLEKFGVDISKTAKTKWKWGCKLCGKKLASELANKNHMKDKHKKEKNHG
jgi:hypothetical protein